MKYDILSKLSLPKFENIIKKQQKCMFLIVHIKVKGARAQKIGLKCTNLKI